MKPLLSLTLLVFLLMANASHACDLRTRQLIEKEAARADIQPAYALALASTLTDCRINYHDRAGRVGLMGVRRDLLPDTLAEDAQWLDYPAVNVRTGLRLLRELLDEHDDWETALHVYYLGKPGSTRASRKWVQAVFRAAEPHPTPADRLGQCRHYHDLDDFGPAGGAPWVPIHDRRQCCY